MMAGATLRISAAMTLGRFYTSTLRSSRDHIPISSGLYQWIRHPGYLGNIVFLLAAGLSVANYAVISVIFLCVVPAYVFRISSEERMLISIFGTQYKDYALRTRRQIPLVY